MSDGGRSLPSDLVAALDELPLFPLRSAVLFPGMLLPLRVFEPRYLALVKDSLRNHRSLAVAFVTEPDADMAGAPPIASIAGVGTIIEHAERPCGRTNIVLRGRARVRLQELHFLPPYRRAVATVLRSKEQPISDLELTSLHSVATAFAAFVRGREASFKLRLPKRGSAGELADAYAHQLIINVSERQQVLETLDIRERVRRVTEALSIQRATLTSQRGGAAN